jgi:hypothetical protein
LLPGLVDIHAASLEMALAPRPKAPFSPATVLSTHDAELTLHGITTDFHCVGLAALRDFAKSLRMRGAATVIVNAIRNFAHRALLHTRHDLVWIDIPGACRAGADEYPGHDLGPCADLHIVADAVSVAPAPANNSL